MTGRWIAFGVACLVVAAAAFGAGAGSVALFTDSETISGSFSVADDRDRTLDPWSENGTVNDSGGDLGNGSDAGPPGNGTTPNGTTGGNDSAGENGTAPNGTTGGENGTVSGGDGTAPNGTTGGENGTVSGGNGTAPNGTVGDGGNDTAGGNTSDGSAGDGGNETDDAGGPNVTVTSVELTSSNVLAGEESGVLLTVQNDGNASASFTATMTVDGNNTASGTIALGPGEQSTLTLSHTFQSSGNYTLQAAGIDAGTVTVAEPSPELSVANADVGSTTVAPNETVTATATVTNGGAAGGTTELAVTVNGSVVGTTSVTVAPGESVTVSFAHSFADEGTHALAVDGVSAGTVEVVGSSGNATASS